MVLNLKNINAKDITVKRIYAVAFNFLRNFDAKQPQNHFTVAMSIRCVGATNNRNIYIVRFRHFVWPKSHARILASCSYAYFRCSSLAEPINSLRKKNLLSACTRFKAKEYALYWISNSLKFGDFVGSLQFVSKFCRIWNIAKLELMEKSTNIRLTPLFINPHI